MPCAFYEGLVRQRKSAQQEWADFYYDRNKALRGLSDRESKEMAKAAKAKIGDLTRQMEWHDVACQACAADRRKK
jgi:hypothetical protein